MSKKEEIGIVSALTIVILVLGIIVTAGGFKMAKITGVEASQNSGMCPSHVYSEFVITLDNTGEKDTSVCLTAWSNEINLSSKSVCYLLEYDRGETSFRIKIDTSSPTSKEIMNVTINYKYTYKTGGLLSPEIDIPQTCKYKKEAYTSQLDFVSE